MKLNIATKLTEGIEETLTYMSFPIQHWRKIRINNSIEELNKEIILCKQTLGTFPSGKVH